MYKHTDLRWRRRSTLNDSKLPSTADHSDIKKKKLKDKQKTLII